jgi:hypothetical protein
MRCAICKIELSRTSDLGSSSVIGEEAHIVARERKGPRGDSPLNEDQRDEYSNLILLCPTDHTTIDKIPAGVEQYPIELLLKIKQDHEHAIIGSCGFDKSAQVADEQWARIIDELSKRLLWDTWQREISLIFAGDGPMLYEATFHAWQAAAQWIYTRFWPDGHARLRDAIQSMGGVLNDFLEEFHRWSEARGDTRPILSTERFYKIPIYNEKLYHQKLQEYLKHVALVQDLALELTRYGNHVTRLVQDAIDVDFRFDQGVLTVRPADGFKWEIWRPEFSPDELATGRQPYVGIDQFLKERGSRDYVMRQEE